MNTDQAKKLLTITKAIFELTQITTKVEQLKDILAIANTVASTLDRTEHKFHPDLSQNLVEFILLSMDDIKAGVEMSPTRRVYQESVAEMLELQLDPSTQPSVY